jgi:hypothetical protein
MLVSTPNGEYATFMRNQEGRFARMRMDDGVHYAVSAVARLEPSRPERCRTRSARSSRS